MRCPGCERANPSGARFCAYCGVAIAQAPEAPAERRQTTIVFSDLSGYTALNERIDPEEVETLVGSLRAIASNIATQHGGTLNQYVGDEVVMLFGVPVARHDDPVRAVRAARALHEAVRRWAAEAAPDWTAGRLTMHSGVNTGLIVTRRSNADSMHAGRYAITGDTVNTGARLLGLAGEDDVVVGMATWHEVEPFFEGEPRVPVSVRGKAHPLAHVRILAERTVPLRSPQALVGRARELRSFEQRLGRCANEGLGGAIALVGEPGIGKTRFAEVAAGVALQRAYACHLALVLDSGILRGRDALGSLARGLLGVSEDAVLAERESALRRQAAVGLGDFAEWLGFHDLLDVPVSGDLKSLEGALDRAERERGLRRALFKLLQQAVARQPCMLIIEDLHWADHRTLEHLVSLVLAALNEPVLFMFTTRRDGDPTRAAPFDAIAPDALLRIELEALDDDAARALAAQFPSVGEEARAALVARAAGHPLFLEQLLLNAADAAAEGLPGSVQTLVLARLDRLPSHERHAVQAASVLGQRFSLDMLRHVLQMPAFDITPLVDRRLVQPLGGDEFLFGHALIRDGAYQSLLKSHRRQLHARAGDRFLGRDAALAAYHLDQAGDPRAVGACREAALEESRRYRYDAALSWVQRGLALACAPAERQGMHALQASILLDIGRPDAARQAWQEAADIANGAYEQGRSLVGLAACQRLLGGTAEASALLDRAEPLLAAAAGPSEVALEASRMHHLRGGICFILGNADCCLQAHTRALEAAREAGSIEAEANATSGLGDAHYMRGRMRSAHVHYERCVWLSKSHGLGRVEVANAHMAAWTSHYDGPLELALAQVQATIERAVQVKHLRSEMILRLSLVAIRCCHMGRTDHVFEELDRSLSLARTLGAAAFEVQSMAYRAECLWVAGRIDEARALAPDAAAQAVQKAPMFIGAYSLGALALITDDSSERDQALADGSALLARGALSHNHFDFHASAIDALLACGDHERALHHADALALYTVDEPVLWSNLTIDRARALARHLRGERSASLRMALRECSARCAAAGFLLRQRALCAALDADPGDE